MLGLKEIMCSITLNLTQDTTTFAATQLPIKIKLMLEIEYKNRTCWKYLAGQATSVQEEQLTFQVKYPSSETSHNPGFLCISMLLKVQLFPIYFPLLFNLPKYIISGGKVFAASRFPEDFKSSI